MTSIEQKLKNRLRIALKEQSEKPPKGIKIGDTYTNQDLYNLMKKNLGLCGSKYQEK